MRKFHAWRTLMRMRGLLAPLLILLTALACVSVNAQSVPWPGLRPVRNLLRFDGFTDTVPDFVGPIDGIAELTIFTEGNHYAVLLPLVLQRFPEWCRATHACDADAARTLVVALPPPMVGRMLPEGGISLGNAVLPIGRDKPVFPDLVMGGVAPLRQLRAAGVVEGRARIFAHTLGMGMLVPKSLTGVGDLEQFSQRINRLIVASASEPGARQQYRATLAALLGEPATAQLFAHEVVSFGGRLGIQHRDVPYALLNDYADGGSVFRHLPHFHAHALSQQR